MLETMQETKNILSEKIERKEDESAKDLFEDLRIFKILRFEEQVKI